MTIEIDGIARGRRDDVAQSVADALRTLPADRYVLRGDAGYDAARVPWNQAVSQLPAAVATPRSAEEVAAIVRGAAGTGVRVAAQSTGHNAGPLADRDLGDVILVRTSALAAVAVDAARRTARAEGGALWLPAVEAASASGLAALHGSSPDVGIVGYSLGGGIGWYARKLGLAANSVTAVELVVADGTVVRASADENAPLFWALRGGGGGSFGVVTALEFGLYPIETAYAGLLVWDISHAEEVLRRWAAWAPEAPDEVTTSFRILRLPPVPEVPEPFRGRSLAIIDGAVLATDDAAAAATIAELRALSPEIDTFARVPARSLVRLHMDPEGGAAGVSDSAMLAGLPDVAIDRFLDHVGAGVETSVAMAELRQLGGALARRHAGGGVLSHLDGSFVAFAGAMAFTEEMAERGRKETGRLVRALEPFRSDRVYLNFCENPTRVRDAFGADAWMQLKGIRSAVDPAGVFVANHDVPRLFEHRRPTP